MGKKVLPAGPLASPTAQKQLCYIVKWTDVPGAQATLSATQVLDYVAPRELEEWERELALKLRQALEERKLRQELKEKVC